MSPEHCLIIVFSFGQFLGKEAIATSIKIIWVNIKPETMIMSYIKPSFPSTELLAPDY